MEKRNRILLKVPSMSRHIFDNFPRGRRGDTKRKDKLINLASDDDLNALNDSAAAENNNWALSFLEPKGNTTLKSSYLKRRKMGI